MGQSDVAQIIEDNYPEWLNVFDIMERLDINETSVRRSLKCLETRNEVQMQIIHLEKSKRKWLTYYRIKNGK